MPLAVRRAVGVRAVVAAGGVLVLGLAFAVGVLVGAAADKDPAAGSGDDVLDAAADSIAGAGLHPVDRQALDAAAVQAMLRAAGDTWGSWSPDGGATGTAGAGVGLWLRPAAVATGSAHPVLVAQVTPGSPAAGSGVRAGDRVRAVDGRTSAGLSAPQVAGALRGAAGSTVTVLFQRGSDLFTVRLERRELAGTGVLSRTVTRGRQTTAVLTVPAFTAGTGRDVQAAVERARSEGVSGIVLDLRGNPGGLLEEAVQSASAFLRGGPVVTYVRRDGHPQQLDATGDGDTVTPLVVLVDGGTASAAEALAGALQDRDRAVLVGGRTFGKGTVQEPVDLPSGASIDITVARYETPSGRSPDGVGLEPDVAVPAGTSAPAALRRAEDVLGGLLPASGARR